MEPVISSFVERKLVKVTDSGPIMPLGGIYGPTLPQVLSTKIVAVLLQKGYHVTEILNNKSEVKLTLTNYNLDLNGDGGKKLKEFKRPSDDIAVLPKKVRREAPPAKVEEKPVVEDTGLKVEVAPPPSADIKVKTGADITITTPGGKAEADTKRDEPKSGGLMSTTKKNKPKADELISK